jgi:transcriptional enhancer factor
LEAALIEGLENYQPDDTRETRLLGRFPMRNRFISDWIFDKTGKRRTAKQVGSRLQQLRDTCGGKRLLSLLSPNRRLPRPPSLSPDFPAKDGSSYGPPPLPYDSESCSDSSGSPPPTPTEAHTTLQSLLYRGVEPRLEELPNTVVYIDLLAGDASTNVSLKTPADQTAEDRSWTERGFQVVRASHEPRHLVDIDSTVTLASAAPIEALSHFSVHSDDGLVFSESVPLEEVHPTSVPTPDGALLYKTRLVPEFWDTIVQAPDASRYVIIQRVTADPASSPPSAALFSAMYRFNYTSPVSQPQIYSSPTIITMDVQNSKQDYGYGQLIPMDGGQFATDMIYPPPKAPTYFDFSYVPAQDGWSSASDTTGSVYASPIDTQKPIPFSIPGDEQLMSSSSFPSGDTIPSYGL